MAAPSYTYTLANSTTADADEVMQNFNDILNGVSDGSKDLSISALTVAGAATFNGAVTLGNATGDDLTPTGRWAADMDPKTASTYALGSSTLPWQSINVDNGATDGGAIYFGGTTTDFLKSSVDGATLNVGGFTQIDLTDCEIKGTTEGAAVAAGNIGEFVDGSQSSTVSVSTTANNYTDLSGPSLTCTAGVWLIFFNSSFRITANVGGGDLRIAIREGSNTLEEQEFRQSASTDSVDKMCSLSHYLTTSDTKTVKLSFYQQAGTSATTTWGTSSNGLQFYAVRIA